MSDFYYDLEHAEFVHNLRQEGYSWSEVEEAFAEEYGEHKSHDTLRINTKKLLERSDLTAKLKKTERPKILIYDIETAPMLGYIWGLWDNNVALNQIAKDWNILSYAAKWLGEDKIYYQDQSKAKNIEDESHLLQGIWDLLNEADVVITHNGKKFDERKLNARFFKFDMKPIGKKRHIDTLSIAKREFAFTSNKLEYLTREFCVKHKKKSHSKFPGFQLWVECLKGNKAAWREMKDYNIADVQALEELYLKLAPYDNTVNFNLFHDREKPFCNCGSSKFNKTGFVYSNVGKFQRYTCKKCGSHTKGKTNLLTKAKKKSLRGRIT